MIPQTLMAGDSWSWDVPPITLNGYTYTAATHTLVCHLRGPGSIDLVAVAGIGGGWLFAAPIAQTGKMAAGLYAYQYALVEGENRTTASRGTVRILADLADVSGGHDPRSPARQALEQAEEALRSYLASGGAVKRWRINGREQEFADADSIRAIIDYWKIRVRNEIIHEARARGKGDPTRKLARFV